MSCVVVLVALNLWPVLISPRDSGWGPGAQLIDSTYQFSSERIREPSNDSLQLRLNIVKPEPELNLNRTTVNLQRTREEEK